MYCLKCQNLNDESARFCGICGTNLRYTQQEIKTKNNLSSTLLLVYILIAFVAQIINLSIQTFLDNWYDAPIKYIIGAFWLLQNCSFILIALSIKNIILKIIGIIFASLLIIYWIYSNVIFMIG